MITPAYSATATERVLPKLALDFTTASLDARVTVTRADNTATCVNSSGYVEVVNANLPRFDYDPTTLACKGLLIEETRENVSAEVNNWTTYAASLTPDVATSPAGTTTGDLFAESATSDTHLLYRAPSLSATAYTFSVFYKIVGARKLALYHTNTNTGRQFDASGVQSAGLFNAPSGGYSVASMGNGWYRASITITAVAGANEFRFWIVRASDNALNYPGDGSSGAYLWGAQIEAGAFLTSYIPTTTTSVTRNADVVSMTGTNLTSWLDASQGTFVAIGDCYRNTGGNALCALSAGATYGAGNGLLIRANGNTGQIGGNASSTSSPFTRVANTPFTICGTYAGLNATSAVNGANANSIANLDFTGSGTTTFVIGALTTGGSNILNGHAQKIYYYPQQFAQSQVVAYSKFGV